MEDLMKAYDLLQEISVTTNQLDYPTFGGFWCMLAEEYCRANHLDVLEVSRTMCNMISQVNEDLGAYL